jgi:AP2-associated kinase
MASQQQYHAYAQNKGTLTSGQSIPVGKFTVQVERYLSQGKSAVIKTPSLSLYLVLVGGFSHVYLVRTPTPVYNTTHHVLKRIAVANEAMLTEVKKEVDIMVRRHFCTLDVDYTPFSETS